MSPSLPEWLVPDVLACDGLTIFAVDRVQQAKPPQSGVVLMAGDGSRYPLEQCHKAGLGDLLSSKSFIDGFGKAVSIRIEHDLVVLSDRIRTAKVHLQPPDAAALSLAGAFEGSDILDEEV
ncbi:MAG: hypothetical protein F6K42_22470 [Leptolyngbya sp. SIO1D8]|nr:hypothetical protein [Leptolyngbya sp. SIO1D8]